jgi:hypothetical protein
MHWMSEDYKLFVVFFSALFEKRKVSFAIIRSSYFQASDYRNIDFLLNRAWRKELIFHSALFSRFWCSIWAKSIEWFIEDHAFFLELPPPLPPAPPVSKLSLFLNFPVCRRSRGRGGRGVALSQIIRPQESLAIYNHSILYVFERWLITAKPVVPFKTSQVFCCCCGHWPPPVSLHRRK